MIDEVFSLIKPTAFARKYISPEAKHINVWMSQRIRPMKGRKYAVAFNPEEIDKVISGLFEVSVKCLDLAEYLEKNK